MDGRKEVGTGCFLSAVSKLPRQTCPDSLTSAEGRSRLPVQTHDTELRQRSRGKGAAGWPCHGSAPRPKRDPALHFSLPVKAKSPLFSGPRGKEPPRAPRLRTSRQPSRSRYSHVGLQAEPGAGARWHGGEQQHQGQGHRAPRRPRLRKERHLARGAAPGPSSGPQLTGRPGGPSEPPPPRAPWPGERTGRSHRCRAGSCQARGGSRCGRFGQRGVLRVWGRPARHPPQRGEPSARLAPRGRARPASATPPAPTPPTAEPGTGPDPAHSPDTPPGRPGPTTGPSQTLHPQPGPSSAPNPNHSRSWVFTPSCTFTHPAPLRLKVPGPVRPK